MSDVQMKMQATYLAGSEKLQGMVSTDSYVARRATDTIPEGGDHEYTWGIRCF